MPRTILLALAALALAVPAVATAANDPLRSDQPNLDLVESDAARPGSTGRGAVVAIIDTGVKRAHPDLQGGRLLQGYDFVDNDTDPQDDVDGHGTHVLGIVGAAEGNGVGISSVAPGAKLLPIRVLDNTGSGSTSDVARGIDFAVAQGADVINLSLGSNIPLLGIVEDEDYDGAIRRALAAGVVVVASSGNNGTPVCEQASASDGLLCVGAVDNGGMRTSFSSFGGGRGIMAPGDEVLSTFRDLGYTRISGTSQAAPHVAGVAALLVAKGLRGQDVVNRLLATARDAGPSGPDGEYGAGIVNARSAVAGFPADGVPGRKPSTPSSARIKLKSPDRIRTILKRGVRVRCRAAGTGSCRVGVSRAGKRLARGSRKVTIGRSSVATAKLNKRGRALLRRALRKRKRITLRVRVTLPGSPALVRRLKLRP